MPIVEIETLTPVHVGSGRLLQPQSEYFYLNGKIAIINERKVFDNFIKNDKVKMQRWVSAIENGYNRGNRNAENVFQFLSRLNGNKLKPEDVADVILEVAANSIVNRNRELREQIRTGTGQVYLPGTSLKGAIRTALLTHLIQERNSSSKLQNAIRGKKDEPLIQEYLGKDPNNDIFRLLQLGDVYFPKTVVINYGVYNLVDFGQKKWEYKVNRGRFDTGNLLMEAIPAEQKSSFYIHTNDLLVSHLQNPEFRNQFASPVPLEKIELPYLFKIINQHTLQLLDEELAFARAYNLDAEFIDYIENELKPKIDINSTESCILRVGFGGGWRFMTGGWPMSKTIFPDERIREENHRAALKRFHPKIGGAKTRRPIKGYYLPGFVRLTITDSTNRAETVAHLKTKPVVEAILIGEVQLIPQLEKPKSTPTVFKKTPRAGDTIDAVLNRVEGKVVWMTIFLAEGEKQVKMHGYSNPQDLNSDVVYEANINTVSKKNEIIDIRYKRIKP